MSIPFVHVQASGSYRELGRAVGEAAREQVRASVDFFRAELSAMTSGRLSFADAERLAVAYDGPARRWLPDCVEELEGLAEGSGVPYLQLLVLNCAEELTATEAVGTADPPAPIHSTADPPAPHSGEVNRPPCSAAPDLRKPHSANHCTAVAVAAGGRHVVGHNMDWCVIDAPNNVLFDLTEPDGTRVMGLAGAPYLLMLGMNDHGIGNVSNSVHSNDNRIGVPNVFVRRSTLSARTLEEAREKGLLAARARGTNHFFADASGRLWDVETSATRAVMADHGAAGFMAHTNHYVAQELHAVEGDAGDESRVRLATAERMLAAGVAAGGDPVELVTRILRSHEPSAGECICGHPNRDLPVAEQGMTVGSLICDLDERRLYACAGPPCENPYRVFELSGGRVCSTW